MKKIFRSLFYIAFLLSAIDSYAQFRIGPVGGLNLSRFKYTIPDFDNQFSPDTKFKRIVAPHFGLLFDYGFNNNVGIEGGALASFKGGNVEMDITQFYPLIGGSTLHGSEKTRLTYLEVPFLFRAGGMAGKMNIHFITGFSAALGLSGNVKTELSGVITYTDPFTGATIEQNIDEEDEFDVSFGSEGDLRLADYSLNIGAGILHENGFSFRIQYLLGLKNLAPEDAEGASFKNDSFSISAGWLFLVSKKKEEKKEEKK